MSDEEAEALYDLCMTYAKRIGNAMQDLHKVMQTFPEMKHVMRTICRVKLGDKVVVDYVSSDKTTVQEFEEYLHGVVTH